MVSNCPLQDLHQILMRLLSLSLCSSKTAAVVVHVSLPLIVLLFAFFVLLLFVHLVSFDPVLLFPPLMLCLPLLVLVFVFLLLLLFVRSQVALAHILLDQVAAHLGIIPKAVVEELGATAHLDLIPKVVVEELGATAHLDLIPKVVVEELGAAAHLGLIPKAVVGELRACLGLIPKAKRARHRHPHNHHQHHYLVVVAHLGVEAK
jgi:hypothetical protein